MSDPNAEEAIDRVTSPVTLAALEASIRRHRIWLIILTLAMVLSACGATTVVGLTLGLGATSGGPDMASDERVSGIKEEIGVACGDRLEDVQVRAVEVKYGAAPFPYSLMSGGNMESLYVEYRLKDSDVLIANLLEPGMYGDSLSASGMLPMKGSLASRMSLEQFERLLAAYGSQTKTPLGSVRRYGDRPYLSPSGSTVPDEVTVGDARYSTKELWSVTEGKVIKGESLDISEDMGLGRNALIFREDKATGEFVFLGTEPAELTW